MKRVITLMLIVIVAVFSLVFEASAESFAYDEASFEIPDDSMTSYISDYCDLRFVADDDSAEFMFSQVRNGDGISSAFMSLEDILDYYTEYLTSFSDDFEALNIQNYDLYRNSNGVNIDGSLYSGENEYYADVYIFPTESYIYVFEFIVYDDNGFALIYEIIDSISVIDYSVMIDDLTNDNDEPFFEIIGFIFMLIFVVMTFIITVNLKKSKQIVVNDTAENDSEEASAEPSKPSIMTEKFEFNGKSINALNEKFTVGSKDDNFALKELERERKEREKMF